MNFGGDHSAPGHGKISAWCVPEGASDGKNTGSWQYIACVYSNTAIFGKICVARMQKAPQSAVEEYTARTSCRQGAFSPSEALESCTARESCRPLMAPPLRRGCIDAHLQHCAGTDGPAPCAGDPARAAASRDRLSTAWPLLRGACPRRLASTRHLPIPATRCTPPFFCSSSSAKHVQLGSAAPSEEKERSTSKN